MGIIVLISLSCDQRAYHSTRMRDSPGRSKTDPLSTDIDFKHIYKKVFGVGNEEVGIGSGKGGEHTAWHKLNKEYDCLFGKVAESAAACREANASKEDALMKLAGA